MDEKGRWLDWHRGLIGEEVGLRKDERRRDKVGGRRGGGMVAIVFFQAALPCGGVHVWGIDVQCSVVRSSRLFHDEMERDA